MIYILLKQIYNYLMLKQHLIFLFFMLVTLNKKAKKKIYDEIPHIKNRYVESPIFKNSQQDQFIGNYILILVNVNT